LKDDRLTIAGFPFVSSEPKWREHVSFFFQAFERSHRREIGLFPNRALAPTLPTGRLEIGENKTTEKTRSVVKGRATRCCIEKGNVV